MDNAKLTDDFDFDVSSGYIEWATKNEGVRQHIDVRLNLRKGDFSLAPEDGTPYYEYILGCKDKVVAKQVLDQRITDTPDVITSSLRSDYDFEYARRKFKYNFSCSSTFGEMSRESFIKT